MGFSSGILVISHDGSIKGDCNDLTATETWNDGECEGVTGNHPQLALCQASEILELTQSNGTIDAKPMVRALDTSAD